MKLTINALADLTGLDRRKVKKALADLKPEKEGRTNVYPTAEALPLIYCTESGVYDLTQERARLAHHQANAAAYTERKLAGELVDVAAVAEEVGKEFANVRAKLLALPSKAAPELATISDTAEACGYLSAVIHDALEELVSA